MNKEKIALKIIVQIFIVLISFLLGGVCMVLLLNSPLINNSNGKNYVVTKDSTKVIEKNSLANSVTKIYDAVVVIQGYENDELSSTGTGFVYKVDNKYGYILTNEHVISGVSNIEVVMTNEEKVQAKVLGKDEYLDLAVLQIDKKPITLVANMGSSEKMNLGDTVFTVGSPLGYDYRGSVTSGVLSGKDRMVSISVSSSNNNDWIMRVLQIDASINPGNSGGPLLNVNGEVIGICSMKLVDDNIEGMGFAIPIEYAMSHVDSLEQGKKIKWPVLGVSMVNLTDSAQLQRNDIKVPDKLKEGVAVVGVKSGTSADKAGIKKGDIITKIDGVKVKDTAYLRYELYQHQSGDTMTITFIRNNKENTIKVKLTD